jgi:sugar porter (SP) family MFS transporter
MDKVRRYAAYLLVIAGCGGLLFDFGGTIIGPALPYIGPVDENPGSLGLFTTAQVSHLSSAVVMCAALACLAAGWLTEKLGRKFMMLFSAAIAALACLPICMTDGNYPLFFLGRAMQGVSAGFIGVVVPMYLAECLDANSRGKGAGMFQLLDFVGITFCSIVGLVVVHTIGAADDASVTAARKALAWKTIFWSSAAPAILFFLGALGLKESPRWLYRRGRKQEALAALAANNGEAKAKEILAEMIAADEAETAENAALAAAAKGDTLFQRKYVLPFFISLAVLICNQAIGFNAIQYFSIPMFMRAGLSQTTANAANFIVWLVPIPITALALWLVDRSGRKTLLKLGTMGMVVALVSVATTFLFIEKGFLSAGRFAGWATVAGISLFVASFSIGPGVVVWLALSELMPGRIRANGMAIALFLNQMVAFAIADAFLPWQKACGYAVVFYCLAFFAFLYFLTAVFLLPETKGKTLEEIERYFTRR